ncbi:MULTISPECIES: DUF3618 domain-containing protein [Streptomyces]|uniref:DUF3618 domain-containing protein n=2 Tax=Streptomyces TaxID=1883 RepID=A0A100Y4H3_9ACTN|nr:MULTISPECIES: DUF3618 domain-containing protein [Streptomyces]KUH37544.1 hypothetical protein ATE80_17730 [Streptomyces kanasensis]UUS30479.1 DUF3618 domain-containing protein [Streptomyces changanensis]
MTRPDELRLEAAQRREELVETLDQLVAKTDLRARFARADHRPMVLVAAAVGAVVLAGVLLSRSRQGKGRR